MDKVLYTTKKTTMDSICTGNTRLPFCIYINATFEGRRSHVDLGTDEEILLKGCKLIAMDKKLET